MCIFANGTSSCRCVIRSMLVGVTEFSYCCGANRLLCKDDVDVISEKGLSSSELCWEGKEGRNSISLARVKAPYAEKELSHLRKERPDGRTVGTRNAIQSKYQSLNHNALPLKDEIDAAGRQLAVRKSHGRRLSQMLQINVYNHGQSLSSRLWGTAIKL